MSFMVRVISWDGQAGGGWRASRMETFRPVTTTSIAARVREFDEHAVGGDRR